MDLLDVALCCVARGWSIFPCKPRGKEPLVRGGFHAAASDETTIRQWWAKWPDANVGIATGASGLTVLDIDAGIGGVEELRAFNQARGLPETYTVRTGRRPDYGAQLYFVGAGVKSIAWDDSGTASGDIRGATGYVLAAGSIHPSGEAYEVITDTPIADVPPFVLGLKAISYGGATGGTNTAVVDDGGPITQARNNSMTSILGRYRNEGHTDAEVEVYAHEVNESRMDPQLGEAEMDRLIANACKWELPTAAPTVMLGGKVMAPGLEPEPPQPVDWRTRYATFEQFRDVQPPSFLIENFLEDGSITGLGAPVAQRKSIVIANVIRSLLTGEPLFDHFKVLKKPTRVLYLCPEMGLVDIANRFKKLGLEEYVGKTLFIRTMDDPKIPLTDLSDELPGAVLILDTLTRFVTGNQNDAGDMALFADLNYTIKRQGATIMLLHHAIKGTGDKTMSLDNALRGSTELAAFVTCVWSTQLQDIDAPHTTPSNLKCVKQRGFASEPFQVSCDVDFKMKMLGNMGEIKTQKQASSEAVLEAILKDNPTMGINKLQDAMKAAGHPRGGKWITAARLAISRNGVTLSV